MGILHLYPFVERVYREDKIGKLVAKVKIELFLYLVGGSNGIGCVYVRMYVCGR